MLQFSKFIESIKLTRKNNKWIRANEKGKYKTVKKMINKRFDINLRDSMGWNALHISCYYGNKDLVLLLLSNGLNVNELTNPFCSTPLRLATVNDDVELIKILLDHGADLNKIDRKLITPIENAIIMKNHNIIRFMTSRYKGTDYLNFCIVRGMNKFNKPVCPKVFKRIPKHCADKILSYLLLNTNFNDMDLLKKYQFEQLIFKFKF